MRPSLTELEGRDLLSTFTVTSAVHDGSQLTDDTTAQIDSVVHGNSGHDRSELLSTHNPIANRRGRPILRSARPILSQTFSGTSFPSGWQQFLPGEVSESPTTFLTITDPTGLSSGIAASASKTVPFNPVGVQTTITAQISSVSSSPLGNAIFGLIGPNGPGPKSELAAGIDAQGDVFIVEYSPIQKIKQTVVQVGSLNDYAGGPVTMTLVIKSTGVQITAGTAAFRQFTFAKDLHNFSMKTAFRSGAYPALVAASQPGQHGGAASFQSISIVTGLLGSQSNNPAPGPKRSR
jgi:hypothetical protein